MTLNSLRVRESSGMTGISHSGVSLHGGTLSSQKAAHHLQTAARSQHWPETHSHGQEIPKSLIGNLKPCNLPILDRLGSVPVGIDRTNGTKWDILWFGQQVYFHKDQDQCQHGIDLKKTFWTNTFRGRSQFLSCGYSPLVNKNCADKKKQQQIRQLYICVCVTVFKWSDWVFTTPFHNPFIHIPSPRMP